MKSFGIKAVGKVATPNGVADVYLWTLGGGDMLRIIHNKIRFDGPVECLSMSVGGASGAITRAPSGFECDQASAYFGGGFDEVFTPQASDIGVRILWKAGESDMAMIRSRSAGAMAN